MRSILPLLVTLLLILPLTSLVCTTASGEEVLKPTKAYGAFLKAMRRVPVPEKPAEEKKYALAYLKAWDASGRKPTPTDNYVLSQFQQKAQMYTEALGGFHAVQGDEEVKEKTRHYAANAEAGLLLVAGMRSSLGKTGIDKSLKGLCKYADAMQIPAGLKARSALRLILAQVYAKGGQAQEAHAIRMQLLKDDPSTLSKLVRPIVRGFLRSTHALDQYDAMRKQAATSIQTLRNMQEAKLAESQKKYDKALAKLKSTDAGALDAGGNLKKTSTRKMSRTEKDVFNGKRSLTKDQKLLAEIAEFAKPLVLLGTPAQAWTLERAFGDLEALESLKGKVVVLDFFATMHDHCNFPLMRDLVKEYGEKGLAAVGVTVSSSVVYAERYAADEDMRSKTEPGAKLYYAARLATEKTPSDGEYILNEAAYRAMEIEVVATFIANHELKWPVVMIAKTEPNPNFAQETWPHLVVLDKQGRIRYFRGGELLRSDKESNAALRTVIEDLLKE